MGTGPTKEKKVLDKYRLICYNKEKKEKQIMKKTYTIIFNTNTATFGGYFEARNILTACVKAVAKFHHLGARFHNIKSVEC